MSTHYQQDISCPAAFTGGANVVLPTGFRKITIINMQPSTDIAKVAYVMFSDPAGTSPPNPVRLVPGSRSEALVFTEQDTKNIWVKGDGAPTLQFVCEGERR